MPGQEAWRAVSWGQFQSGKMKSPGNDGGDGGTTM